jgi:hypothetical protein
VGPAQPVSVLQASHRPAVTARVMPSLHCSCCECCTVVPLVCNYRRAGGRHLLWGACPNQPGKRSSSWGKHVIQPFSSCHCCCLFCAVFQVHLRTAFAVGSVRCPAWQAQLQLGQACDQKYFIMELSAACAVLCFRCTGGSHPLWGACPAQTGERSSSWGKHAIHNMSSCD